jgi:3-oxoacyl-[acyl-carrier protein] reductase
VGIIDSGVSVEGKAEAPETAAEMAREITAAGGTATAYSIDASDFDAMGDLIDGFVHDQGRLDVVVTAAGILRVRPIWEMSSDDWSEVLRTHATHTFAVARHTCRYWRARHLDGDPTGGRLVTMVAATGLVGRPDLGANHAAAKGAIAAMTLELAHEMFPYGVTVNAVCAADVRGRMAEHVGARIPEPRDGFDPGAPGNTANVIAYLCTGDAAWISGQVVRVIGGLIGRYRPWQVVTSIEKDSAWDVEQLRMGVRRLFEVFPETKAIQSLHRTF